MRNLAKKLKLNILRDRGEYFGIVGAISITITTLISYLINLSLNPSFNITTFAVSELGTGPKISSGVFGLGLLIASFCQIPLYISVINYFRKKECSVYLIKIVALGTLFSTISHNILSLVPFERVVLLLF